MLLSIAVIFWKGNISVQDSLFFLAIYLVEEKKELDRMV